MIPRPIFKLLALILWPLLSVAGFMAWFHFASPIKTYYLGWNSKFLYERLLLPPLPRFPGSKPEPEHYTILGTNCGAQICLATPQSLSSKAPVLRVVQYAARAVVLAELRRDVYGGSLLGAMWLPIVAVPFWLVALFGAGTYLDYRRRRRILAGVQLLGRWPVAPEDFSGLFPKWKRSSFRIDVQDPPRNSALTKRI